MSPALHQAEPPRQRTISERLRSLPPQDTLFLLKDYLIGPKDTNPKIDLFNILFINVNHRYLPIILIIFIIPLSGCTDEIKETLNPDLDIIMISYEHRTITEEGYKPINDHVWLFITLNITNNNDEGPVPITAYQFYLIDPDEIWCRGFEGDSEPTVQPGDHTLFTIYFEIEEGKSYHLMEYRRTLEDPIKIRLEPGS